VIELDLRFDSERQQGDGQIFRGWK